MKKLLRPITMALSAVLLVGSLASCTKTPVPDEIYQLVEDADSAKIVIKMEFTDYLTAKVTMKMEGDKAHLMSVTDVMGVKSEEETYQQRKDGKLYTYSLNDDGKWEKDESDDEDEEGVEEFKELFDTENYQEYDKESRRYEMKDDVEIEVDDMVCSDGYIEVGEDGSFVIFAKISQSYMGVTLEGSLKITVSDIGEVSVKLPEVDE